MAENTKIEWADHTVNFWWGCAKVSPGCTNCYAETLDARFHANKTKVIDEERAGAPVLVDRPHWGPDAPRLLRVDVAVKEALRYQRRAEKEGRTFRVFTNSMSDFFEDRRDLDGARMEALDVMRRTPNLIWIILTKRPERIMGLLGRAEADTGSSSMSDWLRAWMGSRLERPVPPANIWLGTTVEDQERADLRIPSLLGVPAVVRFLSCEPLLGSIDLAKVRIPDAPAAPFTGHALHEFRGFRHGIDWVIAGGESGPHARPMHPEWARGLRDQCAKAAVPFLFKQWGEWAPNCLCGRLKPCRTTPRPEPGKPGCMFHCGKERAGRLLDGVEQNGYPEVRS